MKKILSLFILCLFHVLIARAAVPVISVHPVDVTICDTVGGLSHQFSVSATGAIAYQWQFSKPFGNWSNVPVGSAYSGFSTAILTINPISSTLNRLRYRCIAIGTTGTDTSNEATITVNSAINFVKLPKDTFLLHEGDGANLTFGLEGTNLTSQWYGSAGSVGIALKDSGYYSGTKTGSLKLTNVSSLLPKGLKPPFGTYNYYTLEVSNGCDLLKSSTILVLITPGITITTQPSDASVCTGASTSTTVKVKGYNPTYQWQVNPGSSSWTDLTNGGVYSNVTTATLNFTTPSAALNGYLYRCIISTVTDVDTTRDVKLSVDVLPVVTSQPANQIICIQDTGMFSVTVAPGGASYLWQYSFNGTGFGPIATGSKIRSVTESTLLFLPEADHGYNYVRCKITLPGCPVIYSDTPSFKVNGSAAAGAGGYIDCVGNDQKITSILAGKPDSYQWQYKPDTVATPVTVTNIASKVSVTIDDVNIYNAEKSFEGLYRIIVYNTGCPNDTSTWIKLTLNDQVVFTSSSPASVVTCPYSTAVLSVTAHPSITEYEWKLTSSTGGSPVSLTEGKGYTGTTTPTLNVTASGITGSLNYYRCYGKVPGCPPGVVSDVSEVKVSSTINPSVHITTATNPVCADSTTAFTAAPYGGGPVPSYQWYVNSLPAGTNSAKFKPATIDGGDSVKVVLTTSDYCATPTTATSNTITITQLPCLAPDSVSAGNIGSTSVRASWPSADCAATYQVRYRPVGTTTWKTVTVNAGTLNKTITGLLSGTPYEMQVRIRCNAAATIFSGWSPLEQFTTLIACTTPTGVTITKRKKDRVTVTWGAVTNAYSYQIRYRMQGTTNWETKIVLAPITTRVITGLSANTTYEYQLISICDTSGKPKSNWTNTSKFKTSLREGEMETALVDDLVIYPNPVSDRLCMSGLVLQGSRLIVTDVLGRTYFDNPLTDKTSGVDIEVDNYPAGVYLVTVKGEQGMITRKFVKQ